SYALSLSSINQANNKISIQSFINGIDKIKSDILTKYKFINKDKNFECMQNNHLISFNKIYLLINKKDLSKNIIDDIAKRLVYFVPNIPTNRIDVINQLPLNAYTERNPILFFGSPEYIPNAVPKNRLFNIDYRHNPTDGWDWCRLANYSLNHNVDTESSKMRFIQFIETIKKETLGKTYIFGTGPSLDKAIYRDWSDGYRIVCNTIVRDPILWNHINPHFIVAGDAIYHFGQTVFAKQFRQDLAKRLDETETYFFYPDLFDVIVQRELSQFSDKLIPIPEEYYEKINTDLTKKFIIPGLNNVLASLLFPLACTLSKQIYLWGFDGRAPGDKLFWKNSEKHTYPHLIPELQKAHPAFFEHYVPQKDTNRYIKLAFGELLDQLLIKAESEGFTFTMMHKSWTTTLQKRFRNDNVLTNDYQSFFAERKLCPNPFISLEINRIGKVSVCCPERMNDGYKYFGNIINHSLNEIWNSKQLQNLRQIMYDGQYDISCKPFCPQLLALQKGKIPPWYSHLCEKDTHTEILKNKTILSSTYKSISVASDGSCNLNCIMCRHEKKVQPDEFEKKINLILYDQILLNISEIRFLELTGNGDPFYSSEVNILLKRLRTVDTQHLTIRFITNAQLLNKKKWQQIEQLNLKELRISVSIDAASQSTYESIRRGAKWSTLMEHMNMLAQKRREGKLNMLQVNFCVMKRNIHEMIHFIHLAKSWNCDSIEFQRIMGTLAGDENIFDNKNSIYLQKLASVIKDPVFEEKWIEASSLLEYRNYIPEKNTSMNNLDSDKQSNIKKIAIFIV
ncbi:radical SAM protein, partial [Candidatus Magnetomorum sp. HK-1]